MPPVAVAAGWCGPHSPRQAHKGQDFWASTPTDRQSLALPVDVRLQDRLFSVCGAVDADSEKRFVGDAAVYWPRTITGPHRRDRRIWYKDCRRRLINKWVNRWMTSPRHITENQGYTFNQIKIKSKCKYLTCDQKLAGSQINLPAYRNKREKLKEKLLSSHESVKAVR